MSRVHQRRNRGSHIRVPSELKSAGVSGRPYFSFEAVLPPVNPPYVLQMEV